ncbi:hypothetical protein HUU62_17870 [Rhodoferax sp. 4810]|uniref:Uncharacterized protein n=1 Tax=Thiospirillum jenense TaxID=1653858 RepID=A0A839HCV8_9GAMM|nr:hypothetical protein [Thiospirillum jenense]MBB1076276.1 hypothetical protein [Rhodoferax jenense]MBB1124869.1 hypothetical protein [Thiospirillum jenense]
MQQTRYHQLSVKLLSILALITSSSAIARQSPFDDDAVVCPHGVTNCGEPIAQPNYGQATCGNNQVLVQSYMINRDGSESTAPNNVPVQQWTLAPGAYQLWVHGGIGGIARIAFNAGGARQIISAGITPNCTPSPSPVFTIPNGSIGSDFSVEQLISGMTCGTHAFIHERGFIICAAASANNTVGYELYFDGKLVSSPDPGPDKRYTRQQAQENCDWNMETKPQFHIRCVYNGEVLGDRPGRTAQPGVGYELYFDGKLVSSPDPGPKHRYTRQQAQENCNWNMETKPQFHIRCIYNGEVLGDRRGR